MGESVWVCLSLTLSLSPGGKARAVGKSNLGPVNLIFWSFFEIHATDSPSVFPNYPRTTPPHPVYREVQLDLTSEMGIFYTLFERCHTRNRKRSIKQHMRYFKFSWTTLSMCDVRRSSIARVVSGAGDRFVQKRFTSIVERGIIILTPNSIGQSDVSANRVSWKNGGGKGGKGSEVK